LSIDLAGAMSRPKDCSEVKRACRAASTWAEHVLPCFYAACCENNTNEARRLLRANPKENEKQLRTDCKKMGNPDVGLPALDCAHNIRDCH
jgi:hypothetical protein